MKKYVQTSNEIIFEIKMSDTSKVYPGIKISNTLIFQGEFTSPVYGPEVYVDSLLGGPGARPLRGGRHVSCPLW